MNKYLLELLKKMPSFTVDRRDEYSILKGSLILNHKGSVNFYKKFEMEIIIDNKYPNILPKVYELSNILSKDYHINPDGSLCLGTDFDIRLKLYPEYKLIDYIEYFIYPFLYNSLYYKNYKVSPYGERSHGEEGIIESYIDFFKIEKTRAKDLFSNLNKRKFKRKLIYKDKLNKYLCPCGSGKKIYQCHKEEIKRLKNTIKKQDIEVIFNINQYINEEKDKCRVKKKD